MSVIEDGKGSGKKVGVSPSGRLEVISVDGCSLLGTFNNFKFHGFHPRSKIQDPKS